MRLEAKKKREKGKGGENDEDVWMRERAREGEREEEVGMGQREDLETAKWNEK